jgi:hypothetical protein
MKAPPGHVEPITADQLRKIIAGLKYPIPPIDELSVWAAAFTGAQSCNRDPMVELASEPEVSVKSAVIGRDRVVRLTGKETVTRVPVHLRGHDMKHWRKRRRRDWRDFAPDIAARFRQAMRGMDPDLPLGDRDGPVASFVAAVVRLIFPDQHPSVSAVGQFLARWHKTRTRR